MLAIADFRSSYVRVETGRQHHFHHLENQELRIAISRQRSAMEDVSSLVFTPNNAFAVVHQKIRRALKSMAIEQNISDFHLLTAYGAKWSSRYDRCPQTALSRWAPGELQVGPVSSRVL